MNQRESEDKKPLMDNILDLFARKSAQTAVMQQVISITEPVQKKEVNQQQIVEEIQNNQLAYLLGLMLQFGLAFIFVALVKLFNFEEKIKEVPFIIWLALFGIYLLSIALAQFGEPTTQKQPKNIFLFIVSAIARIFFVIIICISTQLNIDVLFALFFINVVIGTIFFQLDRGEEGIKNGFLISEQPWRISFILLFEILFVGLYLNIQTIAPAIIWSLIIFFIYCYMLLNIQLVEYRKHLYKHGNSFLLSHLYFDGDIIFPCYFLAHHLYCTSDKSVLK